MKQQEYELLLKENMALHKRLNKEKEKAQENLFFREVVRNIFFVILGIIIGQIIWYVLTWWWFS